MENSNYNIFKKIGSEYIVFNTFSKSIVKLNARIGALITENKIDKIEPSLLCALSNQGIVVSSKENEKHIIHKQYLKVRNSTDNIFITLLPTLKCNFRCPYCFEGTEAKNTPYDINFDILKKAAEVNLKNKKHIHITLFGGEPLLKWSQIYTFFEHIKNLSNTYGFTYSSSIATNAYFLSKDICRNLINVCHTESFQITIDGYETSHNQTRKLLNGQGTYDVVLNNLKQLITLNTNNSLNILLRINLLNNSLEDVQHLLNEFSIEERRNFEIYFRPIYNTKEFSTNNNNKTNLEPFYSLARKQGFKTHYGNYVRFWHCEGDGGLEQIHILPDLSIWKCANSTDIDEANIGRILENGELQLDYQKIENWKKNDPFEDPRCSNCVFLPLCWGGCPLNYMKKNLRTCIYEKNFDFIETFIK